MLSSLQPNYSEILVLRKRYDYYKQFSAYGKNSEDVTRHLNRSLVTEEETLAEKVQGRYFKEVQQVMNEENIVAGHILSERKAKIEDDKPVHIGFSILAWSKLLFLR